MYLKTIFVLCRYNQTDFAFMSIKCSPYQCGILSTSMKSVVSTKLGYCKKIKLVLPPPPLRKTNVY